MAFSAGDWVTWNRNVCQQLRGQVAKHGEGPFQVKMVVGTISWMLELDTRAGKGQWLDAGLFAPAKEGKATNQPGLCTGTPIESDECKGIYGRTGLGSQVRGALASIIHPKTDQPTD